MKNKTMKILGIGAVVLFVLMALAPSVTALTVKRWGVDKDGEFYNPPGSTGWVKIIRDKYGEWVRSEIMKPGGEHSFTEKGDISFGEGPPILITPLVIILP